MEFKACYGDFAPDTYSPTGLRLSKEVYRRQGGIVNTNHIWSGGDIIAEYGSRGATNYLRGRGSEIVKTRDIADKSRYYAYNAHGDTTSVITKSKNETSFAMNVSYEYDAFGNLMNDTGGSEVYDNPFRYNGQYTDDETGLIYLRNRYYDPQTGRFTQEDPYWHVGNMIYGDGNSGMPSISAIMQRTNLYVYCMSDPVNLVDMFGMAAGDWFRTSDEAAIDWAENHYGLTEASALEHASAIYIIGYDRRGRPYYSYGEPVSGSPYNVNALEAEANVPAGYRVIGIVHSHTVTNVLSQGDLELAQDQGYLVVYVVGDSRYSGGVDICKLHDYQDGRYYQVEAVISDLWYRRLSANERDRLLELYRNKMIHYYGQIEQVFWDRANRGY